MSSDRKLETPGYQAVFRDNDAGLARGIYHPDFPYLLISTVGLTKAGHSVHMTPRGTTVEF